MITETTEIEVGLASDLPHGTVTGAVTEPPNCEAACRSRACSRTIGSSARPMALDGLVRCPKHAESQPGLLRSVQFTMNHATATSTVGALFRLILNLLLATSGTADFT